MTTFTAFHNSLDVKTRCINQINDYASKGWLHPLIGSAWMPEHSLCTPLGAITESNDQAQFEAIAAVPAQLALLHQKLVTTCVSGKTYPSADGEPDKFGYGLPDPIGSYWTDWLERIVPGAQVPDLFARTMAGILRDLLADDHPVAPLPAEVRAQVAAVAALFAQQADGVAVDDSAWTAAREQSSAMTDALDGNGEAAGDAPAVSRLLESLCWSWEQDVGEPLDALYSFSSQVSGRLAEGLATDRQRAIQAAGQAALHAMRQLVDATPNFDVRAYFDNTPEIKMLNSPEFQVELAANYGQVTPLVGGRMMRVLLDAIDQYQVSPSH